MSGRIRKSLQWLLGSVAALAVVLGLALAAFGLIVGRVPEYRVQLQDWLGQRSGLVVEFRTLSARLRAYGPELVFNDAAVRTPDRTHVLAAARRGSVGFDLWTSLRTGRLTAGRFTLEAPQIGLIRTRTGRIQLLGQSALPERTAEEPFALEHLPTGRFRVQDAVVSFRDEITGRGPWSLSGVSFEMTRDPAFLTVRGDASLPRSLGRELRFSATVDGPLEAADALVSTFNVEGEQLDLAGWADVLPDAWPAPETGRGMLRVRGVLTGAELMQLAIDADLAALAAALPQWAIALPVAAPLQAPNDADGDAATPQHDGLNEHVAASVAEQPPQMLSYARVAFALHARKASDAWDVSLSNLELANRQSSWRARQIEARWARDSRGLQRLQAKADRLVLHSLWPLLAYLPQSPELARVRALDASGSVTGVVFDYRRDAPDAVPSYAARAQIEGVAVRPVGRAPGFAGLSGAIELTQDGGELRLAARDARFELPRMFREALGVQSADGTVRWRKSGAGWALASDQIRLQAQDGRAVARFTLQLPATGGSPILALSAHAQDLQVSAARKYIPAGKLGARTMQWFDRAFLDGRVVDADLTLDGPIRAFPFRHGEGTFLVRGHVENALFDYQPGWAPASQVTADLEFRNAAMHIRAAGANVGGLRIAAATAEIPDLKQMRLAIAARAAGDLREALQFLQSSPLAATLGEAFARLGGHGPIEANVSLFLPIRQLAERRIEVTTRLSGASLSMRNVNAPVRALTGTFTVRNSLPAAATLQGQWLGGPLQLTIRPEGELGSVLDAHGQARAAPLKSALGLPAGIDLTGSASWRVATAFCGSPAQCAPAGRVRIESDLKGLGIALPEPLGKSAEEVRALQVGMQLDADAILARASFGSVRSLIRVQRSGPRWSLDRGAIRADAMTPALPARAGLSIEGAIERFVLDDWLALRGPQSGSVPLSAVLQAANVRIGTFEFGGYRWADVRGLLQATASGWRVDVDAPGAAGQILIPENLQGTQPLRVALERLFLERRSSSPDAARPARDPRSIPSLQAYVGDLRLSTRAVGAVDLKATRVPQGIRFERLAIDGASAHAEGRGEWLVTDAGARASLQATITSEDVAATLRTLNYTDVIEAKHGELQGEVSWPGGFDGNILERASGSISVRADNGQLLAVQPGAGRMLGLFSVAALPRRLALDFSDLTDKGLAFDTVRGDFELRDGNAYTSNLLLRGPAAEIGIAGRTGLGSRDYDQTAVVTGNLGASLPVAGALAGGPAVGAALLLFSQVFKEPLKGMTRGYYRITGPWDDPTVERVDAAQLKISQQSGAGQAAEE